jgi:hypothetical protein
MRAVEGVGERDPNDTVPAGLDCPYSQLGWTGLDCPDLVWMWAGSFGHYLHSCCCCCCALYSFPFARHLRRRCSRLRCFWNQILFCFFFFLVLASSSSPTKLVRFFLVCFLLGSLSLFWVLSLSLLLLFCWSFLVLSTWFLFSRFSAFCSFDCERRCFGIFS